jgi:hypothetical protein
MTILAAAHLLLFLPQVTGLQDLPALHAAQVAEHPDSAQGMEENRFDDEVNQAHDEQFMEEQSQLRINSMSYSQYILEALPDRQHPRISQNVQYHNTMEQLLTFPMRRPFCFNVMVATVKTFLADLTVQILETRTRLRTGAPGRTTIDFGRSAAFITFGFVYVGSIQWVLMVSLMVKLAPHAVAFSNEPWVAKLHDLPGEEDLVKQVMIDNLWIMPFVYFPVFYILKELLATKFSDASAPMEALRKCRKNMFQDNSLSLLFWIPGDSLAFAAPIYMRLPIEHLISFSWTMLLSYLRGSGEPSHSKKEKEDPSFSEKI